MQNISTYPGGNSSMSWELQFTATGFCVMCPLESTVGLNPVGLSLVWILTINEIMDYGWVSVK